MPNRPTSKACKDCGTPLVDDDGWAWKSGRCRPHWLIYNRSKGRRYYATHRTEERERNRQYQAENASALREKRRLDWQRQKQLPISERKTAKWRRANPERARTNQAKYRAKVMAKNPRYYADQAIQRRLRGRPLAGKHTKDEWSDIVASFGRRCAYCGILGRITKDHIVPLTAGGFNTADNLVPACPTHNSEKGYKSPEEFVKRVVICPFVRNDLLQRIQKIRLAMAGLPPPEPIKYVKITTPRLRLELARLASQFGYLSNALIATEARYGLTTYRRRLALVDEASKLNVPWIAAKRGNRAP